MKRDTLLDFFADFCGSDDPFLIYDDGLRTYRYSYRQTAAAARALALRLREAGVAPGERVLLWCENRPEWVAAFWGCLLAGAVVVPADCRSSAALVARIAEAVSPRVVLTGDEVAWPDDVPLRPWRLSGVVDWTADPGTSPLSEHTAAADDLAEIIFTSGATAEPKGVRITHRNILANLVPVEKEIRKYRPWGRPFYPLRFLNLLPLSHMFGQVLATFIPPMLAGVTLFMRGYHPEEIATQIRTRKVSVLVCVPKMLEILREFVVRECPEAAGAAPGGFWLWRWWKFRRVHRLLGWKFWAFITGAAPLAADVEEFWSKLGYLVIQGYGLTETAPIVTLNHPFHARRGTVGTPIGGVEVKIAEDGEILVRGGNVTGGYWADEKGLQTADGWLRTGDIGALDAEGRLLVRGRKKEMIVTPEGLKVFPEDVERVLLEIPGVKDAAVVGRDRVHAVVATAAETDLSSIVREANRRLEDHQRIQGISRWPASELPRTEGTGKLKRGEVARWVESGGPPLGVAAAGESGKLTETLARYARGRAVTADTTLEELGLSSLERVELMLETGLSETRMQEARTVGDLSVAADEPVRLEQDVFPRWSRSWLARWIRDLSLPTWILPVGRIFTWVRVEGLEHLEGLRGPVIFAANHQSILDVPCILMALPFRWRRRVAPAAAREWFAAHFHSERFSLWRRFTNGLSYYLAALFFNIFTLPQREGGATGALRYAGELVSGGWCILIFPEGVRTETGGILPFQAGAAMMAARLGVPIVPVRLEGVDRVLHPSWRMARPGRVWVRFGAPIRIEGEDYGRAILGVERAVRELSAGEP
ncbi:MAG TPA: AMP-binding protein [Bryobacteraceae bacterium]|nr:AMP-binding protein [Bryobacteraceae bacterium]